MDGKSCSAGGNKILIVMGPKEDGGGKDWKQSRWIALFSFATERQSSIVVRRKNGNKIFFYWLEKKASFYANEMVSCLPECTGFTESLFFSY